MGETPTTTKRIAVIGTNPESGQHIAFDMDTPDIKATGYSREAAISDLICANQQNFNIQIYDMDDDNLK